LCGKRVPALNKIELEDAIVEVCDACSKFGRVVERASTPKKAYKPMQKPVDLHGILKDEEVLFASNYGKRVKEARETRGLTRPDFAKKINERESIIRRIERQEMEPDDRLTEKIERFLNIKLKEHEAEEEIYE
jgi:putative transcription factor